MKLVIDIIHYLTFRHSSQEFPAPLGKLVSTNELTGLFSLDSAAPMKSDDDVRLAVRDLLRHGGFKPTGRSKPASEYLIKAASNSKLVPINVAVDACNAVSLHSGLPISVVDLDLVNEPLRVAIADAGASYIFNQTGQTIDIAGLLCLMDAYGPSANAVKDSQRTKTRDTTCRTLSLIWGSKLLPGRAESAQAWYQGLLKMHNATISWVA